MSRKIYKDFNLTEVKNFYQGIPNSKVLLSHISTIQTHSCSRWSNNIICCVLIELSQIYGEIRNSIDERSIPILYDKFMQLVKEKHRQKFHERLTELRIAKRIAHAGSLELEPYAQNGNAKSADFLVKSSAYGEIVIEATVCHSRVITNWKLRYESLINRIADVAPPQLDISSCALELKIPLNTSIDTPPGETLRSVYANIADPQFGETAISPDVYAKITPIEGLSCGCSNHFGNIKIFLPDSDKSPIQEAARKAVHNSLKQKYQSAQRRENKPFIIAMQINIPELKLEELAGFISDYALNSQNFSKLSGVLLYVPPLNYEDLTSEDITLYRGKSSSPQCIPQLFSS